MSDVEDIIEDIDTTIKVIVIGNGGVGKSSLALRFAKNVYSGEYIKTVGVEFLQKKKFIKSVDKEVQFHVWDTAGQENFDAITKKYYRGAQVAIFVFSVIDRESFTSIGKWKEKVTDICDASIPMILVMNKIDVEEKDKVVTDDEAVRLAAAVEMFLFRTSVKDNIKINEIFDMAAYEYFNKGLNKKVNYVQDVNDVAKGNKEENVKEMNLKKKAEPTNIDSMKKKDKEEGFKINAIPNKSDPKKKKSSCC